MKYIFTALLLFGSLLTKAQQVRYSDDEVVRDIDTNHVYLAPIHSAKFGDAVNDWQNYLQTHLKYPTKAKEANVKGRVLITFVIEKDGHITNAKILRSLTPECDQEAIRIVQSAPPWTPAYNHDKPVRQEYTSFVNFNL